jgi:aryl-alcohol dehydrogenase-like predicted oxidoreductase
MEKEHRTLF